MNTIKNFLTIVAFIFFANLNAQESYLAPDQYPKLITNYVTSHFQKNKIVSIKKDKEFTKTDYEVKLDNGTELKFDKKFNITDIESNSELPTSVIPQKIRTHVASTYPHNKITDWEKERNRQKIKLDNKLELLFDSKGNFLRLDD